MHIPLSPSDQPVRVAALYRFARLGNYRDLREPLKRLCRQHGIGGTLLLAHEGINGTIAGTPEGIDAVLAAIRALPDCAEVDVKLSAASTMPFHRMKVRLKREIVTMGQPGIDPRSVVGTYVEPAEWNALISDPETIVIDTRNDYEVAVGTFDRAINPETVSFREFPDWFRRERERLLVIGHRDAVHGRRAAVLGHGAAVGRRRRDVLRRTRRHDRRTDAQAGAAGGHVRSGSGGFVRHLLVHGVVEIRVDLVVAAGGVHHHAVHLYGCRAGGHAVSGEIGLLHALRAADIRATQLHANHELSN